MNAAATVVAAAEVQTERAASPDIGVQTDMPFTSPQDLQAAGPSGLTGVVKNVPVEFVGGSGSPVQAGSTPGIGSPSPTLLRVQQDRSVSRGTLPDVERQTQEEGRLADRAGRVMAEGEFDLYFRCSVVILWHFLTHFV